MHPTLLSLFVSLLEQRTHDSFLAEMEGWKKEWKVVRPHFLAFSTSLLSACLLLQTDIAATYASLRLNPWTPLLCPEFYAALCLARNVAKTFSDNWTEGYRLFLSDRVVDALEYFVAPKKSRISSDHIAFESVPKQVRSQMNTIIDGLSQHCFVLGVNARHLSYTCHQTTNPDGTIDFRLSICAFSRDAFKCLVHFQEINRCSM
ncbi:MAG: hypothetical protein WCO79_01400 [bacterium]